MHSDWLNMSHDLQYNALFNCRVVTLKCLLEIGYLLYIFMEGSLRFKFLHHVNELNIMMLLFNT